MSPQVSVSTYCKIAEEGIGEGEGLRGRVEVWGRGREFGVSG